MRETASAFSPGGISSFFEICDRTKDGKPITDLLKAGARGGGFGLQKGTLTRAYATEANKNSFIIFINGMLAPEAETTKTVLEMLLEKVEKKYKITIDHKVEIPIGAGFGSSAGGALNTGLTVSKILNLNLTFNQIGKIAHIAEIKCKTGLGTVGPLMIGGCVLTTKPGAPGISKIEHIPLTKKHVIISGVFNPIKTKKILNSEKKREVVNYWGKKTLNKILIKPSAESLLNYSLEFAKKTGFMTSNTRKLVKIAKELKTIGTAQNMIGEAIHTLAFEENATNIINGFMKILPKERILVSKIDFQGARLV